MTDREAFEKWFKAEWNADYYPTEAMYLAWQAATIAERERCAKIAEGGCFLHEKAPDAMFGKACAKAIRGTR